LRILLYSIINAKLKPTCLWVLSTHETHPIAKEDRINTWQSKP
jgi:hypothetical protein